MVILQLNSWHSERKILAFYIKFEVGSIGVLQKNDLRKIENKVLLNK